MIIARQRIHGCILTLRMHPEMRWGGLGYGPDNGAELAWAWADNAWMF